jgi:hypothetical protein
MKKIDTIEKKKKLDLQTETVRALARPDLVVGGRMSTIAGTDGNCTTSACSC